MAEKPEADLVIRKIELVAKTNREKGLMPLTEEDVLKKYPYLKKISSLK